MGARTRVVVIGNGMVGHRFVEELVAAGPTSSGFAVTILGEEPRPAYDRVHLTDLFAGKNAADLSLVAPGQYEALGVTLLVGERAVAVNRAARVVRAAGGREVAYDILVLATGSSPFVPPIPGRDAPGCFVYRTVEDLEAIRAHAAQSGSGIVVGGGLLGLEAANALLQMRLGVHVVEVAPRLMAMQLDDVGAALLRERVEERGIVVHSGRAAAAVVTRDGRAAGLRFADGSELDADMIVFSAGIRPRDELARACGLEVGARGGIVIDDGCRTSDERIFAVGECALHRGRLHGLVAPGYEMARVAAAAIAKANNGPDDDDGSAPRFAGRVPSAKLKLVGVEVATFGEPLAPDAPAASWLDVRRGVYHKLVLSSDRTRLAGGILVGDASAYGNLVRRYDSGAALPERIEELLFGARDSVAGGGVATLGATATICSCLNVSKGDICAAVDGKNLSSVAEVKACTKAGTGCGSCVPLLGDIVKAALARRGVTVDNRLCEHFACSRQELFHKLRAQKIRTFDELIGRHGRGRGCEICKPAVASMLASTWNEHVLERDHLPLQDSNDRFLANIQRDGTYSVVPRVPGGEITPEKLIAIGRVAQRYKLYTKITGGQRIDLFGARVEELPLIWRELVDAGFESGHAYGKALRTVKSCVGSTWCRYGVQDSVSLAIRLEERYKGLRAPHKIKSAVSGCARECAEAQSKDFGVIATERGYNLYVGGNGGMKPRHAELLATDLDEDALIRLVDRFLMFYIRTADRLQRTAAWLESLEGGLDYLRAVIVDDSLGIAAELEADMARVVDSYQCEWKATLGDAQKLSRFRTFVNSTVRDPSIVFIRQRRQQRPATPDEKRALLDEAG